MVPVSIYQYQKSYLWSRLLKRTDTKNRFAKIKKSQTISRPVGPESEVAAQTQGQALPLAWLSTADCLAKVGVCGVGLEDKLVTVCMVPGLRMSATPLSSLRQRLRSSGLRSHRRAA
jgi:hypothetical protein